MPKGKQKRFKVMLELSVNPDVYLTDIEGEDGDGGEFDMEQIIKVQLHEFAGLEVTNIMVHRDYDKEAK